MQHRIYWIRTFCRKVHFHWISFVNEINLSLWQISYLVTCHLITTVWLSSHQFPSPTHRCWVFLLYILSLWKLITDIQCTAEKVYFELCCKGKMAHKLLFISKARLKYNQFMIMNVIAKRHCRLSVFKWSGKVCTLPFDQREDKVMDDFMNQPGFITPTWLMSNSASRATGGLLF